MVQSEGSVCSVAHSASRPNNGQAESDHGKVGYRVLLPPARYIPLSVPDIVESIKGHIPHSNRAAFNDLCQLIEGKALTEFMGIRRRVKKNFRFFSAAAMHRDIPTRRGKGLKKEDTMDEMEVVFLRDLWDLMDHAHYSALSEADWLAVNQERLMLDMPITINWEHCDPRLFGRFYSRFPERTEGLYKHKDRIMVFHRGVGVIRQKDLFIAQKIDLLVKYLVAYPSKQAFYKIAPYLWKSARDKAEVMKQKDIDKDTDPNSLAHATSGQFPEAGRALDHKHAHHITRVSLRLIMPTWKSVFAKLFTQCEVVEPTYKDIICVYRKTIKHPTEKELKADPSLGDKYRRDQRGIVVKRFDELPVADLEILLPDKNVGLKLIDKLTLYGTAVGALVGGIVAFFGASVDLNFVLSTLGMVSGKLFQTYSKMESKKAELTKQMSQTVFDISMDAQEGAIYSVLDEMADQGVKEMLLAYFLLLKHKYPATEDELDELCEEYLADRFDVKIDFAIEDSLPRLLRDGLVEPGADEDDPRIKAVSLEVAHERLLVKWKTAFAYDASSSATLSEQLTEPVTALKGGLTHFGDAMSSVTQFIPGLGKKSKRTWFGRKKKDT